jgi:hypothetical protein
MGESVATTRSIKQDSKTPAVQKNSMRGMPGFIRTKTDRSSGGLTSAKPVGPKFNMGESLETTKRTTALASQGAYIGKRGGSGAARMNSAKFRGSSDESYRATSTGPAGKIVSNKGEPESRGKSEREGAKMGKPTSGFKQSTVKTKSFPSEGAGHRGRMESLKGKARTSWER